MVYILYSDFNSTFQPKHWWQSGTAPELVGQVCRLHVIVLLSLMVCHNVDILQVVHSLLIFDILKKLMATFAEREIELILVILKRE